MFRPRFISAAAFLAFSLLLLGFLSRPPENAITGPAHALDGDSLVLNGEEMRIRGMDAPEYRQTCQQDGQEIPCGRRASAALKRWLERGPVSCFGSERDRYNRLLVLCRVNGVDIGRDLVLKGLAVDYGLYAEEEREASAARRGLWAGTFERPEDYRRRQRESGEARHRPMANTGNAGRGAATGGAPASSRP